MAFNVIYSSHFERVPFTLKTCWCLLWFKMVRRRILYSNTFFVHLIGQLLAALKQPTNNFILYTLYRKQWMINTFWYAHKYQINNDGFYDDTRTHRKTKHIKVNISMHRTSATKWHNCSFSSKFVSLNHSSCVHSIRLHIARNSVINADVLKAIFSFSFWK